MPKKHEFAHYHREKPVARLINFVGLENLDMFFASSLANEGLGIFFRAEVFFGHFLFKKKVANVIYKVR
jgi:hypothetical protein